MLAAVRSLRLIHAFLEHYPRYEPIHGVLKLKQFYHLLFTLLFASSSLENARYALSSLRNSYKMRDELLAHRNECFLFI